jgi:hypothetical protein
MNKIQDIINLHSYSLNEFKKNKYFMEALSGLTMHHYKNSKEYKMIVSKLNYKINKLNKVEKIPYLPVRLFKNFNFLSIKHKDIFKTLVSSGTSSSGVSKIYLDKNNSFNQIKVLKKIVQDSLGIERVPMLIIERERNKLDRSNFNASIAAINGFSIFSSERVYALDQNKDVNYNSINSFLEKNKNNKFLIFGFTDKIYEYLINKISINKLSFKNFEKGILIHGGGWKKLEKYKIQNNEFKLKLKNKFKINNIFNYYGMVEQTGSIFIECSCGYFITSNFSDIIIRDENFNVLSAGKKGFVQLLSLLPTSYPGHSILTEDIGEIIDKKNCKCLINGKRFLIHGRAPKAELRGCSNI